MFTNVQDILIEQIIKTGISECEIGTLFQTDDEWQELWFRLHCWAGAAIIKRIISVTSPEMKANVGCNPG